MRFLVADDEQFALKDLTEALEEAQPDAEILTAATGKGVVSLAEENTFDVAFLDIEMGSSNGLDLAILLKEKQPDIHIIFVTSYEKYAVDAFSIHATGYLMKPVSVKELKRELTFLYPEKPSTSRIRIQTFGGFDIFVDGELVSFRRNKSKELLAILVDRHGSSMTTKEICAILFEDENGKSQSGYFRTLVADLHKTLQQAGAEQILVRGRNQFAVNPVAFECDAYQFLEGDPVAINKYRGNYMICYSWAEYSAGAFKRD